MSATKQQMSVTQALAEMKLLQKRINKALYSVTWADVSTKARPIDAGKLSKLALAEYQSYQDLVKRHSSIKRAVVQSNAMTRVKIGAWEGTVAEAIEQKSSIQAKKRLLDTMKETLSTALDKLKTEQSAADDRLERLLTSELGKDVRTNPETITTLTNTFRENNKVELVDPLDLPKKIAELEEEVESFETNVDWVLSEANGRTLIEV
jgi:archaellum component FlaC